MKIAACSIRQRSLKTSHFLEQKTAPRNSPDAGPISTTDTMAAIRGSASSLLHFQCGSNSCAYGKLQVRIFQKAGEPPLGILPYEDSAFVAMHQLAVAVADYSEKK
jgi:hypothetical protein